MVCMVCGYCLSEMIVSICEIVTSVSFRFAYSFCFRVNGEEA